jgi:tRNA wybutosine-synthesizing protein 4
MANVLCQIQGSKRLLLFPPSDVTKFQFEAGASSSAINAFEYEIPGTNPYEANIRAGDVLFLPPLWLHTASPKLGMHIIISAILSKI